MIAWELPTTLNIGGADIGIRTDFRVVIDLLTALSDPGLYEPDATTKEKAYVQTLVMLQIMIPDWENINQEHWQEATEKICEFIDCGLEGDKKSRVRLMDWEQDGPIIRPAINRVAGAEVLSLKYLHWWTFLGYYMEIGECLFGQVISIRQKKAKGKLEKHEKKWYAENKKLVDLEDKGAKHLTKEEKDSVKELLGLKRK